MSKTTHSEFVGKPKVVPLPRSVLMQADEEENSVVIYLLSGSGIEWSKEMDSAVLSCDPHLLQQLAQYLNKGVLPCR